MKRPVEHGSVYTSVILGASSISLAIFLSKDYLSALYWVPIWMGLFLFDVPIKKIWKSRRELTWLITIAAISIFVVFTNHTLIIPYAFFLVVYGLRPFFASRRLNYIDTIIGMLAYTLLFTFTVNMIDFNGLLLIISLSIFMIGSEFAVRSKLSRKRVLLAYEIVPVLLILLNPFFAVYSLSLVRIPVTLGAKSLRTIGMTETMLLLVVTIVLSIFYVLSP